MPITGSVGALTYSISALNANAEYWAIFPTGGQFSTTTMQIDTAGNVIHAAGSGRVLKLSGFTNPSIEKFEQIVPLANLSATSAYDSFIDNSDSSYVIMGTATGPYSGFPNYIVTSATKLNTTSANSVIFYFPEQGGSPSANNQMRTGFTSCVQIAGGDYYAAGSDSEWNGGTSFTSRVKLYRYSSSDSYISTTILFAPQYTATAGFIIPTKIDLMSNEDPVVAAEAIYSPGDDKIVVQRISKVITPGPFGTAYQNGVWSVGLQLTGTDLSLGALKVDSNDNVYVGINRGLAGQSTLIKLNSSGTIQWQKNISGIRIYDITISNTDDIYVLGDVYNSYKIWIGKFDSTGATTYQRRISLNGSNQLIPSQIVHYNNDLYIAGRTGSPNQYGFFTKIKDDGSIAGTFPLSPSIYESIIYDTPNYSIGSGTLTTYVEGNWVPDDPRNIQTKLINRSLLNTSRSISLLS